MSGFVVCGLRSSRILDIYVDNSGAPTLDIPRIPRLFLGLPPLPAMKCATRDFSPIAYYCRRKITDVVMYYSLTFIAKDSRAGAAGPRR